MNGPSLGRTAVISAALHLSVFLLSAAALKHSGRYELLSPYTVTLVGRPDTAPAGGGDRTGAAALPVQTPAEQRTPVTTAVKMPAETRTDTVRIEDRIAEIAAKKRIEDKIAAIAAKKKTMDNIRLRPVVSVGRGSSAPAAKRQSGGGGMGYGSLDIYTARITQEIHRKWECPPAIEEKDLEAIVSVCILKDGTIKVREIEKRSGNRLFDSMALKALDRASPVSPPPHEMEIGIRFYP